MSSQNNNDNADAEEQHNEEQFELAFGEVHRHKRDDIRDIKNNNPLVKSFFIFERNDINGFTDLSWNLLGRYIANNTHLQELHFSGIGFSDATIVQLFQELTKSDSITNLNMGIFNIHMALRLSFGMAGVQSMLPFLQNSPQLVKLNLSGNDIGSQGFESLVNALDGGIIKHLDLDGCGIEDISPLGNVRLHHLEKITLNANRIHNIPPLENYTGLTSLSLYRNSIGIDGCRALAHLLLKEGSSLQTLNLNDNNVNDEGVEILVTSLKHNKKLNRLGLKKNIGITEKGSLAIMKLLIDISSIENTYNSNHSLVVGILDSPVKSSASSLKHILKYIEALTETNRESNPGRTKIIATQLNSVTRAFMCRLQGIEYLYESIFSDMDALILPEVLALVAEEHEQTELFHMLVTVAPDLSSIVNRPVSLREQINTNEELVATLHNKRERKAAALKAEYESKLAALDAKCESEVAALNAKNLKLKKELELIQSNKEEKKGSVADQLCGKKRDRS